MAQSILFIGQPHVGEMIRKYLDDNGILRADLARRIGMPQSNLDRLLKKPSMDTGRLVDISRAVHYNFFKEFCRDSEYVKTYLQDEDFYISEVNIGALIDKRMKELNITQKEVANRLNIAHEQLNVKQQNISIIIKKVTIETDILCYISFILQYNFFEEYYKDNRPKANEEVTKDNAIPWEYARKVQLLLLENFDMKHKINILRRIIKKAGLNEEKIASLGLTQDDIHSADINAKEYDEVLRTSLSLMESLDNLD